MAQQLLTFDDLNDYHETIDNLPEAEKTGTILATQEDSDDYQNLHWRSPIYVEDNAVGDVSQKDEYYHVIQYDDVMDAVGTAIEDYTDTITPSGHIRVSDSGHKMSAYVDFDGLTAEPIDGDVIDLGLKVQAAHTGFHGINYDIGAQRVVCSNGMVAFVADNSYTQTHSEPLDYGKAKHAVDSIVDGVGAVEDRIQAAEDRTLVNRDEALLVLMDHGIDRYLPSDIDAVDMLGEALDAELAPDQEEPSLYDTYNAATRALTHMDGVSGDARDAGLERAAHLLDQYGDIPDPEDLGQSAVERRVDELTGDDADQYWDDEETRLNTLVDARGADAL